MSTRSSISMIKEDGSVSQVYCHWDGYISNNGIILFNYYQNVDKIKKLISLGDMSSLKPEVEPNGYHTYNSPQDNVTISMVVIVEKKTQNHNNLKISKNFYKVEILKDIIMYIKKSLINGIY